MAIYVYSQDSNKISHSSSAYLIFILGFQHFWQFMSLLMRAQKQVFSKNANLLKTLAKVKIQDALAHIYLLQVI